MFTTSRQLTLSKGAAGGGHPLDRSDLFETLVKVLPGCRQFLLFQGIKARGLVIHDDKKLSFSG